MRTSIEKMRRILHLRGVSSRERKEDSAAHNMALTAIVRSILPAALIALLPISFVKCHSQSNHSTRALSSASDLHWRKEIPPTLVDSLPVFRF